MDSSSVVLCCELSLVVCFLFSLLVSALGYLDGLGDMLAVKPPRGLE